MQFWNAAAHYSSVSEMMGTNHFCPLQYDPGGGAAVMIKADYGPPRVGTFGVLLPDILLILRVRHGRDVWQSAIVLGGVGGKIRVADFRDELYSNGHMAGLGLRNMIRDGCGFINFLGIYNALITGRILLSWFPQAQGQPLLQPLFVVTDPFLNLFRGLIPPIGGLDLSILPALLILSSLGNAIPALGADLGLL